MLVELRPFTAADAAAHDAGEDELTVRWLNGAPATPGSTLAYVEQLAAGARSGRAKRAFGIWVDGRLGGYLDHDLDLADGIEPDDVNLSYAVHPWARGRGVAVAAVRLACNQLRAEGVGRRAAIRVEPANVASVRVAEKAGFRFVREFVSSTDRGPDGSPVTMRLYVRDL